MLKTAKQTILGFAMTATMAFAETNPFGNVFFGFEFVLQPIAIKWGCGGARDQDLIALEMLVASFPEDAERAALDVWFDEMFRLSGNEHEEGLERIYGTKLTEDQTKQVCSAARDLNISWITPEQLVSSDDSGAPPEQKEAWEKFWLVVETLQ